MTNGENPNLSKYIVTNVNGLNVKNSKTSEKSTPSKNNPRNEVNNQLNFSQIFHVKDETQHIMRMNSGIIDLEHFLKQVNMNEVDLTGMGDNS